jgi:UMF1 family MFS transporter
MNYSRKTQNAWAFYDWANSVYSLVISTAVFPIYYSSVSPEAVSLLGREFSSTSLYSYSLAFSFILVAILSPFLSGIADYTGNKKKFLKFFCYLGASACVGLFFFKGQNIFLGLGLSVVASVGFWGSLVFYNAFLPEIAAAKDQDALSAKGFSLGYIGASILLIINLVIIQMPQTFGFSDAGAASRFSFLLVGLWWAGFAQVSFRRLPLNVHRRKPGERYIFKGFQEIAKVAVQLKDLQNIRRFLYSFFFFSVGVQTVILLASLFGEQELGLDASKLILTILIIQFVAIGGAHGFSFLSQKMGNLGALKISLVIWVLVCFGAYTLSGDDPSVEYKFYAIGGLVGLVLGGTQSLSRSSYSKLIPASHSNASFFSFYDVSEKIAVVVGTFTYGYLIDLTGNMKASALALSVFFLVGWLLLNRVSKKAFAKAS